MLNSSKESSKPFKILLALQLYVVPVLTNSSARKTASHDPHLVAEQAVMRTVIEAEVLCLFARSSKSQLIMTYYNH